MKNIFIAFIVFVLLTGCSGQENKKEKTILTVQKQTQRQSLFFNGNIQPKSIRVLSSQVDGVVVKMPVKYGEFVNKGDLIFSIHSVKFFTDYKNAIMAYVKAKSERTSSKTLLDEADFLHKNELISDDDFQSRKSSYYASQLAFLQAKDTLSRLIEQLNVNDTRLYQLKITDIEKINSILHSQKSAELINIYAPESGVLLAPATKNDDGKLLEKGSQIKQGDVLTMIGDMSGLSVDISVNETTVNKLKVGQPVKVTGIAFPNEVLSGLIKRVNRESTVDSTSLPKFYVNIIIPKISPPQHNIIHVGMSAKVEILLTETNSIIVPYDALHEEDEHVFVSLYNPKTQLFEKHEVEVGKTLNDHVLIISGLQEGDKIDSHYKA